MPSVIIDGIEYCLEIPNDDDGDDTNKPSSDTEIEVASHCKQVSIS